MMLDTLEAYRKWLHETYNAYVMMDGQDTLSIVRPSIGVSISKREKCTLSKTECFADLLIWLHKRVEEKDFGVWKVCSLVRSSMLSVLSRMLTWLYRLIHLLSVHFSRISLTVLTFSTVKSIL